MEAIGQALHAEAGTVLLSLLVGAVGTVLGAVYFVAALCLTNGRSKSLPGPVGLPVIGCSYILSRYEKVWDAFADLRKEYGDVFGLTLGSRRCVVLSSPDAMKEVLVTKAADFANRPDFLRYHAIFRGNRNYSIALCDWSSKQKIRRDLAYPFMHPKQFTMDMARLGQQIDVALDYLLEEFSKTETKAFQPRRALLTAMGCIFYQFFCSKTFDPNDAAFVRIVTLYNDVFNELFQGFAIDFMPWLKIFNSKKLASLQHRAAQISKFTADIMEEHEKTMDCNNPRDLVDIVLTACRKDCLLEQVEADVIIEDLLGGHPVVANLLVWSLYILSAHEPVQERIRKEVDVVTKGRRRLNLDDKRSLPYTEATIMEILRVVCSPVIPHVTRTCTTIQEYKVPENTIVLFNTYSVNMDPDVWKNPHTFEPERFLLNGSVTKPDHFFPFGTGKRSCLGSGIVKAILLLTIPTILQKLILALPEGEPCPDLKDIPGKVITNREIQIVCREIP